MFYEEEKILNLFFCVAEESINSYLLSTEIVCTCSCAGDWLVRTHGSDYKGILGIQVCSRGFLYFTRFEFSVTGMVWDQRYGQSTELANIIMANDIYWKIIIATQNNTIEHNTIQHNTTQYNRT